MDILAARKKAAERARAGASAPGMPQAPVFEKGEPEEQVSALPPAPKISFSQEDDGPLPEKASPTEADRAAASGEPAGPSTGAAGAEEGSRETVPGSLDATVSAGQDDVVDEGEQEQELLAFLLGAEEYAVPVDLVQEVLTPREITPVPHSKEFVLGVCSLRGIVLPIIDLHRRLGLPGTERDERSRILVMNLGPDDRVGLFVDRVRGVVRLLPSAVRPVPETIEQGAEFLQGIARKDDRMFILLDAGKTTEI